MPKIKRGCVMVKSMTGFGRGEAADQRYKITVELKSVNNRYLEVALHSPRLLLPLEHTIKSRIAKVAERGKVDVYIQVETVGECLPTVNVDLALSAAYMQAADDVAAAIARPNDMTVSRILGLPGVLSTEKAADDMDEVAEVLNEALGEALAGFAAMRELEGGRLAADLLARRDTVRGLVAAIDELSANVAQDYQARLTARISELLSGTAPVDEARLANEVAYFADHACINEELIRLDSHLRQLADLLGGSAACGRKLDFLLQEINREVNTIGSKANYLEISQLVIEAKSELEKIREQVQNLE